MTDTLYINPATEKPNMIRAILMTSLAVALLFKAFEMAMMAGL